jgi:hypothetical protein
VKFAKVLSVEFLSRFAPGILSGFIKGNIRVFV